MSQKHSANVSGSQTVKKPNVFLEDAWKTPGRRGHLSQNRMEDTDPLRIYGEFLCCSLNAYLPKVCARGVHVFQASSRRLPRQPE